MGNEGDDFTASIYAAMPEGGIPVTLSPYSSTVALVSTIFALLSEVIGAPEEDSSTGMMRAAFSFTVSSVRSSLGEGMERIIERPPSTLKVSSSIFVLVAIVGLLVSQWEAAPRSRDSFS